MNKDSILKPKEQKVVKGILEGKSVAQAVRDAGYATSTANTYTLSRHKKITNALIKAYRKAGISEADIAQVIKDALIAQKDDPADHFSRLSAAKLFVSTKGYLAHDKQAMPPVVGVFVVPAPFPSDEWEKRAKDAAENLPKIVEAETVPKQEEKSDGDN